jgi:hypothetical protein
MDEIEKAPLAESAFSEKSLAGCLESSEIKPPRPNPQEKKRGGRGTGVPPPRYLRLVAPAVPPQPRCRYETRITVSAARLPVGRTRPFHLSESDIAELIDAAMKMEARLA